MVAFYKNISIYFTHHLFCAGKNKEVNSKNKFSGAMDGINTNVISKDETREKTRKRRYSTSETDTTSDRDSPDSKFRLIATSFQLLDFSDEVLFEIFKYLDTWTLMALMNCCTRLSSLILDHRFWNYIDLSREPLPLGILEDVLERSQGNTTCIKLHGPPVAQQLEGEGKQFSQTLAKAFENCCTNLTVLELQGITIDFRYVRITDFPKSIKRLLLNDCNVRFEGEKSIFFGIDTHLTKLSELAIENSNWFEPYYMMVFSKVPELRSLSLKGCQLLSDFVPYGSMATRFGFKKLEFLDLRFTPISDSDLQCFNAVATLKEVLLDCPESLRDDNSDFVKDANVRVRNCYCHSRLNNTESKVSTGTDNERPSTSEASRFGIKLFISSEGNENGASTSAAAAAQNSRNSQKSPQTQHSKSSTIQQQEQREEDSSSSSCSSSPSSSSSSSNESLPGLLGNLPRLPQNQLELPVPGGNAPAFSRFLPRPDQIILLDLNNRWRRVVMQNVPLNRANGIEEDGQQERQQQQQEQQQPQQQAEGAAEQPIAQQFPQERVQQREQFRVLLNHQQQELRQHILEFHGRHNRNPNNNNNNNNNNDNNGNHNNNNNANQIEQVLNHPLFWDMVNPFSRVGHPRPGGRDADGEQAEGPRGFECRRTNCSGQYHQYHRHRHRTHHYPVSDRGICCFGRPRNPVEHGIIWIRIGNRPSENRFERLSIRNYKLVTDVALQHLVQCSPYLIYLDLTGTGVTRDGVELFKERKPQCTVVADHLIDKPKPKCTCNSSEVKTDIEM